MFAPFVGLVQYMEKRKLDGQIYLYLKLQHKLVQLAMEKVNQEIKHHIY